MNGFLLEEKGENYKSEKENGRGGKAYILSLIHISEPTRH